MISLPMLSKAFKGPAAYYSDTYKILPFRFLRYDSEQYFLTNLVGEYLILSHQELLDFARHRLTADTQAYADLKARHFLHDETSDVALELLSTKYRTKQSLL